MSQGNGVIVTRGISAPQAQTPLYESDDIYYPMVYIPRIPLPSFHGIAHTIWIIEITLLTLAILGAGLFIIFVYKSLNKYRCPRCKKQYCFKNEIPEFCTRCGAKLNLQKIELPE